jgi:hypothetical protein
MVPPAKVMGDFDHCGRKFRKIFELPNFSVKYIFVLGVRP